MLGEMKEPGLETNPIDPLPAHHLQVNNYYLIPFVYLLASIQRKIQTKWIYLATIQ